MLAHLIIGVLLMLSCLPRLYAQQSIIYGGVRDQLTQQIMTDVMVVLADAGGNPIDTMLTGTMGQVDKTENAWMFRVDKKAADYLVRFSKEGYEPQEVGVKFRPNRRRSIYEMANIQLKRMREQKLGEATARATRVMFYTKRDTLVFNADAFQLAEGSMLDALVKQLPGVELKSDGRITVNGKYVESLLLNGEDFFKGDNTVLLDNLPAYMVKQVKVYEKQGRLSEMMRRNMNDKEYVMDVRLKRQYSIGYLGNAESGYGSEYRYLARIFGLRFTPQSRVSAFGNINNVNETRKPGDNGDWTPANVTTGQDATKNFGLDYQIKDRHQHWEASGNANYIHSDSYGVQTSSTTNFLPAGNTYNRSRSVSTGCTGMFSTGHSFYIKWEKAQLWASPNFSYKRWRSDGSYANLDLSQNIFDNKAVIDSMMTPATSSNLWQSMTSRTLSQSLNDGHQANASLNLTYNQTFRNNNDLLQLTASLSTYSNLTNSYSHYLYENKTDMGNSIGSEFRNRHTHQHPDRYTVQSFQLKYWVFFPGNWAIVPYLRLYSAKQCQDYATYRLDRLGEEWGPASTPGQLPSETEYLRVMDTGNSYNMLNRELEQLSGMDFQWEGGFGEGYMKVNASVPVRVTTHKLSYLRASTDTTFRHTTPFIEPKAELRYHWNNWCSEIGVKYEMKGGFVPMTAYVSYTDDKDPLNVVLSGDADLNHRYTHSLQMEFNNRQNDRYRFFNANAQFSKTHNAIAYAQTYNRQTGRRFFQLANVNGNYDAGVYVNYTRALDKDKRLVFITNSGYTFNHNADLIGETDSEENLNHQELPPRSIVKTSLLEQSLTLRWKIGKHNLKMNTYGCWHHATSNRASFERINAGSYKYGMTGQFELPWQMQLATDITMYSRRGYANKGMNTDDLVWNVRVSQRLWRNRITLMIDGFDILHQLSGTSFSINGQGMTETWRNVIPRYFMLHLIYRLNIQPKKRAE